MALAGSQEGALPGRCGQPLPKYPSLECPRWPEGAELFLPGCGGPGLGAGGQRVEPGRGAATLQPWSSTARAPLQAASDARSRGPSAGCSAQGHCSFLSPFLLVNSTRIKVMKSTESFKTQTRYNHCTHFLKLLLQHRSVCPFPLLKPLLTITGPPGSPPGGTPQALCPRPQHHWELPQVQL